jgi:hypothetical protein
MAAICFGEAVKDWRAGVYGKNYKAMTGLEKAEWKILRDSIIERDNFTCLRCEDKFRSKSKLTVHHVVPRADGGSNDPSNLVTLCSQCHDFVEMNDLKTIIDIIGSIEVEVETEEAPPEPVETDWHTWVYGGARNPLKGRF